MPPERKDRSMTDLQQRLLAMDTPSLSDALDKLGLPGAVTGLSPMTVRRRIAGIVQTVRLGPAKEGLPKRHLGAAAIMASAKGDVIVVQHGRDDVSGWGGLLCRGALARGVSGVIIDGGFRDIDEAVELGLPIYGRAAVPVTARGRVAEHGWNEPITVAGVAVSPGDLVLADGSGVVFVPKDRAEEVIGTAEDIMRREALMAKDIEAGMPIGDVLGANYEDMLKKG
jgi:4-hydroxy-4-methyl-2-oxoglutarate aldolase